MRAQLISPAAHIRKLQSNLISRFENLVATAAIEDKEYTTTSYNALHMKDETAALVNPPDSSQTHPSLPPPPT
jgi:hypothetical protein